MARINMKDETERVKVGRLAVHERLKRLARAYVDMLIPEEEYQGKKELSGDRILAGS